MPPLPRQELPCPGRERRLDLEVAIKNNKGARMGLLRARTGRLMRLACVVLMFGMAGSAFCQEAQISRGRQLMDEGKPAQAFALLEPLESAHAGEVKFDYLFGIAALDSGHPDRATIAFERVLAVDPNFAGARLDLARAYFAMGSDDLAKSELDTVMQSNPPENVRAIVARYNAAIEARKSKLQPTLVGYVEAGGGTDSNISAVTSNFTGGVLQAYNIPNVQPTGNSIKRSGSFSTLAAGADYTRAFESHPGWSWYLGGDARERRYFDDSAAFTFQQYDSRTGIALALDRDLFRIGLQDQHYYQEGAAPPGPSGDPITNDRRTFGTAFEWRHALAPGRQFGAFGQLNQQRFANNDIQDINQNLYGVQFMNAFEAKMNPLVLLMAFQSRDRALRPLNAAGTTDVSKTLTGYRAYGQITPFEKWDAFLSVGHTEREDNSMFSRSNMIPYGKDRTFDVALGVNWRFAPAWIARAQASVTDNRANIALYEYSRTEMALSLRREFR